MVTHNYGLLEIDEARYLADLVGIEHDLNLTIEWFPFDMPKVMTHAVKKINPKIMVLLETEIWPGLLNACRNSNVAILIVNGRLTSKSLQGYSRWKNFWQHLRPNMILAVSDNDARRYQKMFPTYLV